MLTWLESEVRRGRPSSGTVSGGALAAGCRAGGRQLVVQPVRRASGSDGGPQGSAARAARSSGSMARARASTVAVPVTSNGIDLEAPPAKLVEGPGLAGQGQHPVAGVDQRALHGHQIEPVADRD